MSTDRARDATRVETDAARDAALHELARYFDVIHQWQTEREGARLSFNPEPGSALAVDDRAADPFHLSHVALHSIGVAVDNLHALRAAIQEASSLHTHAPYSLLRAAIEAAATTAWLLGPDERDERIRRRLAMQVGDIRDSTALTETFQEADPEDTERRFQRVAEVARRRPGIDATGVRGTPPSYGTVVRKGGEHCLIGGDLAFGVWQLCSALAHGRLWASMALLDRDRVVEVSDDVLHVRLTSSATQIAMLASIATAFVAEARQLYAIRAARPVLAPPTPPARPAGEHPALFKRER